MVFKKSELPLITIHEPKYPNTHFDLSDHYPITVNFTELKLISYNLQFMPMLIGVKGKNNCKDLKNSVSEISKYLIKQDVDVCCVQELFDNTANEQLADSLSAAGYLASERLEPSIIPFTSGGVRTFLKKEYTEQLVTYSHYYRSSIDYFIGADAIAHKGLIHTSFIKKGVKYHIINTHLQAYYPTREHYIEITLAQCMELKNFIQQQQLKGIIQSDEQVILCGDFNIPVVNNEQETSFLFIKMKKLLGPQFAFLNYNRNATGPQYTFSNQNSYNKSKCGASDLNINTDAVLVFQSSILSQVEVDYELSAVYGDIQRAIATYIRNKATLFSWWRLATEERKELNRINKEFAQLIELAEQLKAQKQNPVDNPLWLAKALTLAKGPGEATSQITIKSNFEQEIAEYTENESKMDSNYTLEQARELYERLVLKLKQIHVDVHYDYIYFGEPYQSAYRASLMLNRILEREGRRFFSRPDAQSFYQFKYTIMKEINSASLAFEDYPFTWSQLNPIIKAILGVLALLSVLPFLCIIAISAEGYKHTFFRNPTPSFYEIKRELDESHQPSL